MEFSPTLQEVAALSEPPPRPAPGVSRIVSPPTATPRSIAQLNERRRRAVELRLAGDTLAAVAQATGLSAPTIIAAHKAYLQGGWDAVATGPRGRPAAGRARIPAAAQAALLRTMLEATAPTAGEPGTLWHHAGMADWLRERHGVEVSGRDMARLAQRWDLQAPSMLDAARASSSPAIRAWLDDEYPAVSARARQAGSKLWWIGERALPEHGRSLLYAHTPRGRMAWRVAPRHPAAADWRAFLHLLSTAGPGKTVAVLANRHLGRADRLGPWLDGQDRLAPVFLPADWSPAPGATPRATARSSFPRPDMPLTHLQRLEAESIHIMREVVAEADNPVMLYSIGKDSAVMLHLAMKAFHPAVPPFPLLHVDTRWKFRDMYAFRDRMAKELGIKLLVHVNPEGVAKNINPFTHGSAIHTDVMKTEGLKQALDQHRFDAAFGGARRDEEKSRAKERIFSFRTEQHRWDPKNQRPELWKLYNARKHKGESMRVFPLSNWTELDIWQYIHLENIPIVPLYYAALRPVVERDGTLIMVDDDRMPLQPGEVPMMKKVRFRTLGCYPLTGAVESEADTLPAIIQEMLLTRTSERQGRVIDHDAAASMEKKKQEGYF